MDIAAGLSEHRRVLSLFKPAGVSTDILRGVVALESALPLLLGVAVSIDVSLVASTLSSSQHDIAFRIRGILYWATVLCGPAASLAIIASRLPFPGRITGPEIARNE